MKYGAIIFDLDGTLLDTLDDLTAAVNHAFTAYGLTAFDRDRVRRYVGNGVPKLIERALYYAETGEEPDMDGGNKVDGGMKNLLLSLFTDYYDAHNADLTKPYRGITDMISEVKALGVKTAIVTNKYDGAAQALKRRFFPAVDLVVGARSGIRPKPAPDGVDFALSALGADRERAVYAGDGETDMLTAKNSGLAAIAVTWGFRDERCLRSFGPTYVVNEPREIVDILRGKI